MSTSKVTTDTDYFSYILAHNDHINTEDSPILINADNPIHTLTYPQYVSLVKRIALKLRSLGLRDQECVALCSQNSIYYNVLSDGVVAAGGVLVGLGPNVTRTEMEGILKAAGATWLFSDQCDKWEGLKINGRDDRVWQFDPSDLEINGAAVVKKFSSLIEMTQEQRDEDFEWEKRAWTINPEQTAFRQLTSGSIGLPKAADLSHRVVIERIIATRISPIRLSWFYCMNLSLGTARSMWMKAVSDGEPYYISKSYEAESIIRQVEELQFDALTISPVIAEALVASLDADPELKARGPLKNVKLATVVGAAVRPEAVAKLRKACHPKAQVKGNYGSTEIHIVSMPDLGETRPGFVGKIFPGTEVRIIDPETDATVPDGTAGEVCARAHTMFNGYYNNPEANKNCMMKDADGGRDFFRTGDKGYMDPPSGQLVLTGRYKEIFKVGNQEVAPFEVESLLLKHPAIADAAVGPVEARDKALLNEPRAYVVVKEGEGVTATEVYEYVKSNMSAHKTPNGGVSFVKEIPRNAGGKIIRVALLSVEELDGSVRSFTG